MKNSQFVLAANMKGYYMESNGDKKRVYAYWVQMVYLSIFLVTCCLALFVFTSFLIKLCLVLLLGIDIIALKMTVIALIMNKRGNKEKNAR